MSFTQEEGSATVLGDQFVFALLDETYKRTEDMKIPSASHACIEHTERGGPLQDLLLERSDSEHVAIASERVL